MLHKWTPYIRHFFFFHLTMCISCFCIREHLRKLSGTKLNCFYSVVNIVYLTSSFKLSRYSLSNQSGIIFNNICLNRVSVLRRFFDYRHITYSAHSHIESSWNWRCWKSKNIHCRKILLEFFLVCHSETLFLIYYRKPQILEYYIFLYNFVSTD